MNLYSVTNWNDLYENNHSRIVKKLKWVPVPNGHDGEAYSRLMARKDAAKVFAAWVLILQIASRCEPRGDLVKSDGTPHDSESLSLRTRAPASWFTDSLPVLEKIGWVSRKAVPDNELALECNDAAPKCHQPVDEQKGMEGKEGNRKKEGGRAAVAAPASLSLDDFRSNPAYQGIDLDRELGKAQAWCKVNGRALTPRRFVNWLNRVERPLGAQSSRPTQPAIREPEGWKVYLNHEYPESVYSANGTNEAHEWSQLPPDIQAKIAHEIRKRGAA